MPFIIFGTQFYGKVDSVPGLYFVATQFVYFFFFPLFPIQTCLVYEGNTKHVSRTGILINQERFSTPVQHLPLNFKSILVAWLRVLLVIALVGSAAGFFETVDNSSKMYAVYAIIILFVLHLSYFLTRATGEKALELGHLAKFPDEMVLKACNSFYPLFGLRFGKELYRICDRCGTINDASKPVFRGGKPSCSRCSQLFKSAGKLSRDARTAIFALITCSVVGAFWFFKSKGLI